MTDYTVANGMGGIDQDRFNNSLEQIKLTYEFKAEPDASLYFDNSFLPEGGFKLK